MGVPSGFIHGTKTKITFPSILAKAATASEDYREEAIVMEWP